VDVTGRRLAVLLLIATLAALVVPGSAGAAAPPPPPDPTCSPGPADCSLWHNAAVLTVTWAPPPPLVNVTGCVTTTITTDTAAQPVSCTWWNNDGSKSNSVNVRRDATPPSASARADRGADSNGWYNRGLSVEFVGGDALSGIAGCTPTRGYAGPDATAASISGTCVDNAGNSRSVSFGFQYDATPPTAEARAGRKPNPKGWYTRGVRVRFVGSDATSGVGSCAPDVMYRGPNSPKAAVSGTCVDKAGNTSAAAAYELKFDAQDPNLGKVTAEPRNGSIALQWKAGSDATAFKLERKPGVKGAESSTIYEGPKERFVDGRVTKGVKYLYVLTAYDAAENSSVKGLRVRAHSTGTTTAVTPTLVRPANGARLQAPPLLDWNAVPRATYYNVQLFRNGQKVLSAWPGSTSFRLSSSWRFEGRTHRLLPGSYRWYVWPGFGLRAASNYGKLVGTRTFVVAPG
jgi:hypothetical protein